MRASASRRNVVEPIPQVRRRERRLVAVAGEEVLGHEPSFSLQTVKPGNGDPTEWDDEPIRIAAYDPTWPSQFEQERDALERAIGEQVTGGIHHVGSTAVPGLDAKPIIDILVGVKDHPGSRACFDDLRRLGYLHAPYRSDEMHWFCKPHPSRRTHHLHLVPTDSPRFREELAFRDHLRCHPDAANEYVALKRRLAAEFKDDRDAYTAAKGDFIRACLRQDAERR